MAQEKTPNPQRFLPMRPTGRISMLTTPAKDQPLPTDKGEVILRANLQKKNPAFIHAKEPMLPDPIQEIMETAGKGNLHEDRIQRLKWTETGIRIVLPETITQSSRDLTKDLAHQTTAVAPITKVLRHIPATVVRTTPETVVVAVADLPTVAAAAVVADLLLLQEEVDKL